MCCLNFFRKINFFVLVFYSVFLSSCMPSESREIKIRLHISDSVPQTEEYQMYVSEFIAQLGLIRLDSTKADRFVVSDFCIVGPNGQVKNFVFERDFPEFTFLFRKKRRPATALKKFRRDELYAGNEPSQRVREFVSVGFNESLNGDFFEGANDLGTSEVVAFFDRDWDAIANKIFRDESKDSINIFFRIPTVAGGTARDSIMDIRPVRVVNNGRVVNSVSGTNNGGGNDGVEVCSEIWQNNPSLQLSNKKLSVKLKNNQNPQEMKLSGFYYPTHLGPGEYSKSISPISIYGNNSVFNLVNSGINGGSKFMCTVTIKTGCPNKPIITLTSTFKIKSDGTCEQFN